MRHIDLGQVGVPRSMSRSLGFLGLLDTKLFCYDQLMVLLRSCIAYVSFAFVWFHLSLLDHTKSIIQFNNVIKGAAFIDAKIHQNIQDDNLHLSVYIPMNCIRIGCLAETDFRQSNVDRQLTSSCAYCVRHYIFTVHVHINSKYIKIVSIMP